MTIKKTNKNNNKWFNSPPIRCRKQHCSPQFFACCRLSFAWNFNWKILVLQLFKLTHTSSYRCEKNTYNCSLEFARVCVCASVRACVLGWLSVYISGPYLYVNKTVQTWHSLTHDIHSQGSIHSRSHASLSSLPLFLSSFSLSVLSLYLLCLSPCSRLQRSSLAGLNFF